MQFWEATATWQAAVMCPLHINASVRPDAIVLSLCGTSPLSWHCRCIGPRSHLGLDKMPLAQIGNGHTTESHPTLLSRLGCMTGSLAEHRLPDRGRGI